MAFTYVASPYSGDPEIMHQRFLRAELYCAGALKHNHFVYSPIVHCHEMARRHKLPTDAKFWERYNKAMMEASQGLTVLALPGWMDSKGVKMEMDYAKVLSLPVNLIPDDHPWLLESVEVA